MVAIYAQALNYSVHTPHHSLHTPAPHSARVCDRQCVSISEMTDMYILVTIVY